MKTIRNTAKKSTEAGIRLPKKEMLALRAKLPYRGIAVIASRLRISRDSVQLIMRGNGYVNETSKAVIKEAKGLIKESEEKTKAFAKEVSK